jgi:hypothetical protein
VLFLARVPTQEGRIGKIADRIKRPWKKHQIKFNISIEIHRIPVVPHKAVAEVSKIGNL